MYGSTLARDTNAPTKIDPSCLSPSEAEEVVNERIQDFGTWALPQVHVTERSDGRWLVQWKSYATICDPMTMRTWKIWLERNVGPVDPSRVQHS